MNKRFIIGVLAIFFLMILTSAQAQKQATIPRIGILRADGPPSDGSPDGFVQQLRNLGYVVGKNILIEIRYAEGNRDRQRQLDRSDSIRHCREPRAPGW